MTEAHAASVNRGLNAMHFDYVSAHLKDTLEELNVPKLLIGEVLLIVSGTKDDVLGL